METIKIAGKLLRVSLILFPVLFLAGILPPVFLSGQGISAATVDVAAAPLWSQDLGDLVLGQPYQQAESVVVACAGGDIKSFYMSGTPLWNFDPREASTPFLARSVEGATYVCNTSGVFRTINRVGRELWRVDLGKAITYPPVVGWDGRIFIPVESQLFCRNAAGTPLWSLDLGSPIAAPPKLDHAGSFAAVLQNRDFVRVGQFSTVERVRLDEQPLLIVSLKSENQDSYILLYQSGRMEKLIYNGNDAKGGRISRERFPSLPAAPVSAASRENNFAVTLRDGRVFCYSESGQVLWNGNSHETQAEKGQANLDPARATMVFDDRGIYSISTRGVTCFALDGRRRFIHKMTEASSVPAFSDEGLLYVCGKDKFFHTYKLDSKQRNVIRSKYYGPEPEGTYGMGNPPPSPWFDDGRRFQDDQLAYMYNRIEKAIDSGQIGEAEPAYTGYLIEMIGFFLNDPHYSKVRPLLKPQSHIALIQLLGRIGSRETITFLYTIFDRYHEPTVKAACAEAIGKIGVDPYGNTFESYNYLLAANNPNRDPYLIMSATRSIANLCRFSGPPLSGEGIVLLRFFSNFSWLPNNVKAQIRTELDSLYREGLDKRIQ